MAKACLNCGAAAGRLVRRCCRRCYVYLWRHGQERPLTLRQPQPCRAWACFRVTRRPRRGLCPRCYMRCWRTQRRYGGAIEWLAGPDPPRLG